MVPKLELVARKHASIRTTEYMYDNIEITTTTITSLLYIIIIIIID
jgi:hypothetical protein